MYVCSSAKRLPLDRPIKQDKRSPGELSFNDNTDCPSCTKVQPNSYSNGNNYNRPNYAEGYHEGTGEDDTESPYEAYQADEYEGHKQGYSRLASGQLKSELHCSHASSTFQILYISRSSLTAFRARDHNLHARSRCTKTTMLHNNKYRTHNAAQ